jgi:hypothetical protein
MKALPGNGLSRRLHTQNDKKRNKMKKTLFFIKYLNYRMCISKGKFPANKETDMTKTETTRRLKSEVSQPKSALLRILRTIERDGLRKDADQLSNIIARLEDWQNR